MFRLLQRVFVFAAALQATAILAKPFDAEIMVQIPRVGSPALSPDGHWVAYTVKEIDLAEDSGQSDIWLVDTNGKLEPKRLTSHSGSEGSPAWSPDGNFLYFTASRSGSNQVWRLPLNGGEAVQVTDYPIAVNGYKISPDGQSLALIFATYADCDSLQCTADRDAEKESSKISAQSYDQLFMRHWDHWLDEKLSRIYIAQIQDNGKTQGEPRLISGDLTADIPSRPFGGMEELAFGADSKTLFFAARLRNEEEPYSTNFDIYRVNLAGDLKLSNLTESNQAWDTLPVVSHNGKWLFYLAMARPGFEADQLRVKRLDLFSGQVSDLTGDWDYSVSGMAWDAKDGRLILSAQDVGHKTLWQLNPKNGDVKRITSGAYDGSFDVADGVLVSKRNSLSAPDELYLISSDGDAKRLTYATQSHLEDVDFGDYDQFEFAGWNDETVRGFVVYPKGVKKGQELPVAFLIHGGPQGSFSNRFHYRWNPQTYVGQGYAAVMIDFHGSTGYGQEFTDSISGDWGGKPLVDLQKGLVAALDRYPFLDGEKVCALGASYGGYMINWIAGNWPERFDCLVNHDGVFDNRSMYYTTEELWFPEWEHGGTYYENPEGFEKHNPVNHVDQWQTPMLVIHGELDYRVPVTQGIAAFTALQRQGIPSKFVYFPDENHWVLKYNNSVRWHAEVNEWLAQYLQ